MAVHEREADHEHAGLDDIKAVTTLAELCDSGIDRNA